MKLILAEPKYLKDSISIISDIVTEVNFKIDKNNLELVAMDPANVAMIVFKLLSSAFVEYDVEKDISLAISLEQLKQILRRVKPTDTITLELDEDKNKLRITLRDSGLRGDSNRVFNISLLHSEEQKQKIPELEFQNKIETHASILDDAVEDVGVVGDSVALTIDPKRFTIHSEGTTSNAKVEIPKDNNTNIVMNSSDKIKAKYSLEYLKKMIKGSKLTDKVVIQFNEDYPLKLDYLVKDKLSLQFILAPRVQND